MKKLAFLITLITMTASAQKVYPTIGKTESYDASFAKIVSADAKIEVLATGIIWAEGPTWVENGSYLLFSDAPQNTIFKWEPKGGLTVFLKPSGYTGLGQYSDEPGSNGLLINKDGELVACEHGDRRITKMNLTLGGKVTLADNWKGKRFSSPNDICQHSNGTYFFTDPPYGLPGREGDTANRQIKEEGVYSITPAGKVTQVVSNLLRPNGVALSPDEKTLYVSQSNGATPYINAYAVKADGTLGKGTVFFDFSKSGVTQISKAAADGMKVDAQGNIYAGAANGIVVISPQGKALGRIETGVATSNCAFGADGYLYITAHNYLCRIKLNK
ncbi:SMP-30/gluconolactonase/LRE family protein [Flavobacterium subsaxonicum]|uniref:Gluconolactonase n=1 Tax=Flavobacterium subsaxonicum WB 4.1-42 = DSM 21790 TaxID=1121898 RepID=A0A0A2MLA9_9FLAO|nr:SMP-30/gluconolactonase/LRE family protein [Flavobacterium subsaxonicum]KGO93447.1 gluconolactonase [Flavobacterium subsaxonicum WB 4.1-42 = DSM 21790]